jgi:hypothetical protein
VILLIFALKNITSLEVNVPKILEYLADNRKVKYDAFKKTFSKIFLYFYMKIFIYRNMEI